MLHLWQIDDTVKHIIVWELIITTIVVNYSWHCHAYNQCIANVRLKKSEKGVCEKIYNQSLNIGK